MTDETRPDREALPDEGEPMVRQAIDNLLAAGYLIIPADRLRRIEVSADHLVDQLGGLQALLSADLEGAYQSGQSPAQKHYLSDLGGRVGAGVGLGRHHPRGNSGPFDALIRGPSARSDAAA